jgi:hypothetical protein
MPDNFSAFFSGYGCNESPTSMRAGSRNEIQSADASLFSLGTR